MTATIYLEQALLRIAAELGSIYQDLYASLPSTLKKVAFSEQEFSDDSHQHRQLASDVALTQFDSAPSLVVVDERLEDLIALLEHWLNRSGDEAIVSTTLMTLQTMFKRGQGLGLTSNLRQRLLTVLKQLSKAEFTTSKQSALMQSTQQLLQLIPEQAQLPVEQTTLPDDEWNADAVYLNNAGLILLWPFLQRFFDRLGLLQEQHFHDESAQQRGVGLLQYLVDANPSAPEYLLILNKILCGMEPDMVFDFGVPVTPDEAEECDRLLDAVIEHAAVFKNISITGFRQTFLQRRGSLSSRDGAWLLRIEREAYDIVLERLAWNLDWMKLPWMPLALQIEW